MVSQTAWQFQSRNRVSSLFKHLNAPAIRFVIDVSISESSIFSFQAKVCGSADWPLELKFQSRNRVSSLFKLTGFQKKIAELEVSISESSIFSFQEIRNPTVSDVYSWFQSRNRVSSLFKPIDRKKPRNTHSSFNLGIEYLLFSRRYTGAREHEPCIVSISESSIFSFQGCLKHTKTTFAIFCFNLVIEYLLFSSTRLTDPQAKICNVSISESSIFSFQANR